MELFKKSKRKRIILKYNNLLITLNPRGNLRIRITLSLAQMGLSMQKWRI